MRAPARPGRMAPFRRGQKKDIPKERGCLPRDVPLPLFVQIDQLVLPAADADGLGVFERVDAVARLHAFDQMDLALVGRGVHQVDARLVQRHGVQRGEDADVAHAGRFGCASQSQSTERLFITLM